MLKFLFKVTFQSVVLFFAFSFLTVLYYILPNWFNIPREMAYEMNIGFPFQYYEQFWLDKDGLNAGWNLVYLIYDCGVFWLFTFVVYFFKDKPNLKSDNINIEETDILDN